VKATSRNSRDSSPSGRHTVAGVSYGGYYGPRRLDCVHVNEFETKIKETCCLKERVGRKGYSTARNENRQPESKIRKARYLAIGSEKSTNQAHQTGSQYVRDSLVGGASRWEGGG